MRSFSLGVWLIAAVVLSVPQVRSQTSSKGSIEGEVVDASTGQGISGARVRIQSGQEDPLFSTTDDAGHFHFAGLEFKSYRVEARYPGFLGAEDGTRVSLAPMRAAGHVALEMRRSAAIVGRVTDSLGVPLEGIEVDALERDASGRRRGATRLDDGYSYFLSQMAHTNDLGEYRIGPLSAGSYYVRVRPGPNYFSGQPAMRPPPDARERVTYYPSALKPSDGKVVELAEGKELRADVRLIRDGGVKVSGRIVGTAVPVRPDSFESVHLWSVSPGTSDASADVTGERFTFWNVVPGQYILDARQQDADERSDQNVLAAAHRTIEVGTEDLEGVDLTLAPTPNVEVAMVFESGCAAVPVAIQVQSDSRLVWNLHAGTEGRFVWRHAVPAKYRIYVRPENLDRVFATSVKLGDAEVLTDGFEVTAETTEPLRIQMKCDRR
jgi:hypothetical protein